MSSIRVLLGSMPKTVRRAVTDEVDRQADVQVIGSFSRPSELLKAAGELEPDLVVVATIDGELPGIATHLVDQHPDLWVLAVAPEVRAALIYAVHPRIDRVAGSTPSELADAIRARCTSKALTPGA